MMLGMKLAALLCALVSSLTAATVTTLVGTGAAGYSDTQVNNPYGAVIGPDGALYVADWSNPIIQHGDVDFRDPRRDHVAITTIAVTDATQHHRVVDQIEPGYRFGAELLRPASDLRGC